MVEAGALIAVPFGLVINRVAARRLSEVLYGLTPGDALQTRL